jgi:hypothetical protein
MKKLVMLLALAVAFSLSGFAQTSSSGSTSGGTSSTDTGKTSKKSSKKAASSDMASSDTGAKAGKSSTITGCLKSDASSATITNGKHKDGVAVDTSADTTDDWAKHNGHKVQLTGSWEGTGADKKFKATAMKHISETCSAGGEKSSAAGGKKGKKGAADTTKSPS